MIVALESAMYCGVETTVFAPDGTELYTFYMPELSVCYNSLDCICSRLSCALVSIYQVSEKLSELLDEYNTLLVTNYLSPLMGMMDDNPQIIYHMADRCQDFLIPDLLYLDATIPYQSRRRLSTLLPAVFPGVEVCTRTSTEVIQCLVPNDGKRLLINA